MIKAIQQRKELPVDLICLNLLVCQKSVYADIQCGRAEFGNFKLRAECDYAKIDASEIEVPKILGTPDEILKNAKQTLEQFSRSETPAQSKNDNNEINNAPDNGNYNEIYTTQDQINDEIRD